jgi:RsiW-degrading membrane proteinase PrsW (M82 family)
MFIYLFVAACAVLLGWLVYRYDLYEKEPWYLLLLAAMLGFFAMWGLGYLEDQTHRVLSIDERSLGAMALVAASHEEVAKMLLVVLIALLFRTHFNDPMDGLIYGAFAGLGMALEESLFYIGVQGTDSGQFGTEPVRLLLHLLLGGLSGFAIGMAITHRRICQITSPNPAQPLARHPSSLFRVPEPRRVVVALSLWPLFLLAWLTASMTLHFCWDYSLGLPLMAGVEFPADPQISSVALMLSLMASFGGTVLLASRWSRLVFDPTSERRLWRRSFVGLP